MPHHPNEIHSLNQVGGHCPRCGAEYRPGFAECSDCGVPLVPGSAPEDSAVPEGADAWAEANRRAWGEGGDEVTSQIGLDIEKLAVAATMAREEAWLAAGHSGAEREGSAR